MPTVSRPFPTLAELNHGRDNNIHLLRFIASLTVVITHAIALATGNRENSGLHVFGGFVAVLAPDIFFVLSGYLLTGSLLIGGNPQAYLRARVLRIYPALILVVTLSVFVLGPAVTTLPLSEYFRHPQTWSNWLFNCTQLFGAREGLPGVFAGLPYPNAVNGSLWTLTVEIRLYLFLLGLWWVVGRLQLPRERTLGWIMLVLALLLGALKLWLEPSWTRPINVLRLAPLFLIGSTLYLWRDRVPLRRDGFWLALAAMALAAPWKSAFFVVELLVIGYVVVYLAFVPGGAIRRFNAWGDYSYGIYVASFPLQQLLVMWQPGIGPWPMIFQSLLLGLPVAWLSWHFVERPALRLKRRSPPAAPKVVGAGA